MPHTAARPQRLGGSFGDDLRLGRTRGGNVDFESLISQQLGTSPFESEEPLSSEMEQLLNALQNLDVGTTPEETRGLTELEETADPTRRLEAVREQIEKIFTPQAEASLTARGFGRSPAIAEVLGQETTRATLPVLASANRARQLLGQFRATVGQARLGREAGKLESQGRFLLGRSGRALESRQLQQNRSLSLLNILRNIRTSQAGINAGGRGGITNLGPRNRTPFNISGITGRRVGAVKPPFSGPGIGGSILSRL